MTETLSVEVIPPQAMSLENIEAEVTRLMASPAFRAQAGSEADAIALALRGRDLGLPPSTAITGLYTVNGRVSCETWLMMAMVERAGLCEGLDWEFEGEAPPDLAITVTTKRRDKHAHNVEHLAWADIVRAGLAEKGVWPIYPKVMIRWQAIAQLYRVVYADVWGGMYLPGELPGDRAAVMTPEGDLVREVEMAPGVTVERIDHQPIPGPEPRPQLKEDQPEYLTDEQAVEIASLAGQLNISDEDVNVGARAVAGRDLDHWTYLTPDEGAKVIQRMETKLNATT